MFIFNYALQPLRLIVRSGLDVPTFATRRLHACHHARAPSGGRWNCGREISGNFCLNADLHVKFRDTLHAVKLRHGTDGFTSPPKEGRVRTRQHRYQRPERYLYTTEATTQKHKVSTECHVNRSICSES